MSDPSQPGRDGSSAPNPSDPQYGMPLNFNPSSIASMPGVLRSALGATTVPNRPITRSITSASTQQPQPGSNERPTPVDDRPALISERPTPVAELTGQAPGPSAADGDRDPSQQPVDVQSMFQSIMTRMDDMSRITNSRMDELTAIQEICNRRIDEVQPTEAFPGQARRPLFEETQTPRSAEPQTGNPITNASAAQPQTSEDARDKEFEWMKSQLQAMTTRVQMRSSFRSTSSSFDFYPSRLFVSR